MLWVAMSQADKLVLSKTLSLADYGHLSVALMLASTVALLANPVSQALSPRLASMVAADQLREARRLYCRATQLTCVVVAPLAVTLAFFAESLLNIWTGSSLVGESASVPLALYALGNAVQIITAFSYYIQYAHGHLRLHLVGQLLMISVLLPSLLVAAPVFGGTGGGAVWFGVNLLYLLAWVPIVHHRFLPGLHVGWLVQHVLPSFVLATLVVASAWCLVPAGGSGIGHLLMLLFAGGLALAACVAASPVARGVSLRALGGRWQRAGGGLSN
jgi:O-antigen/teichoic acid export membrane protein